jgi:MFS family permease
METDGYESLGYYVLAVLYFSLGMGSLISTAAIKKLGSRKCFILGGIGNTIWIVANILPAYVYENDTTTPEWVVVIILIISSAINGMTTGILWAAANNYVSDCPSEKNRGFYFSYFWGFYMFS